MMGVSFGHRTNPTGLALAEEELRTGPDKQKVFHYIVRYLERFPVGTRYSEVTRRVAAIVETVKEREGSVPDLFIDATGMGEPLVDMVRSEVRRCWVQPVYFTHGDQLTQDGHSIRLGKGYLVARLKILLERGELHLPRTPEADALARDLREYQVEVTEDANERYGAFRVGGHDDLVTALGLAIHRRRQVSVYPKG
jgi:hypothetical protein